MKRVPRTRNNGTWTEARFRQFIVTALRRTTGRWGPKIETKKDAKVSRGVYRCNLCNKDVPVTIKEGDKRVNNVFVDHIVPVVDPVDGFKDWNEFIERLFCEKDNLQLVCKSCHTLKTKEEKEERKKNK